MNDLETLVKSFKEYTEQVEMHLDNPKMLLYFDEVCIIMERSVIDMVILNHLPTRPFTKRGLAQRYVKRRIGTELYDLLGLSDDDWRRILNTRIKAFSFPLQKLLFNYRKIINPVLPYANSSTLQSHRNN